MRKTKLRSYYESTKNTPYLDLAGVPRAVFLVFTGENIPRKHIVQRYCITSGKVRAVIMPTPVPVASSEVVFKPTVPQATGKPVP